MKRIMLTSRLIAIVILATIVALASGGCRPRGPAQSPSRDTPRPTPGTSEFASERHGIRFTYPSNWSARPDADLVLRLAPAGMGDDSAASVSLDVPKLPPHIPGMIPLGMVVDGYRDDLKKQRAGIQIDDPVATKVAGANARRVRSAWQEGGQTRVEIAVLTVHGDRVYIFRANADGADEADAGAALDSILSAVSWK